MMMAENHNSLPARKYNIPRSRTPTTDGHRKVTLTKQNLTYFPSELEELQTQLEEQQRDVNSSCATSAADNDESLDSLMEALEFVHPASLSAKQRIFREAHLNYKTRLNQSYTQADIVHQKQADVVRSKPLRPTHKAVCRPARPPSLYPNYKDAFLYEQLAVGKRLGPPCGNEGGQLNQFFNCRRDLTYHQLEGAWKGALRSLANHTNQTSTRRSKYALNRGTVMGAHANPDKLVKSLHLDNSFNRYATSTATTIDDERPDKTVSSRQLSQIDNVWYEG
jgi:hypothetical protein